MSFSFRDHFDELTPQGEPSLPPEVAGDGMIPDDLVDQMLDGDIDGSKAREVMGAIRRDREASRRLDSTDRILRQLKSQDRGLTCPDFSDRVLARVSARSGLFSPTGFRRMLAYRYAAAAVLLLSLGGMFLAQRVAPESVRLVPQPAPVSRLVRSMPAETAGMLSGVRHAFSSLVGSVPTPGPSPLAVRRLCEMTEDHSGVMSSRLNPPLQAILWTDEAPARSRSIRCGATDHFAKDTWATSGPAYHGILLDDSVAPFSDSDVVFVTLGR